MRTNTGFSHTYVRTGNFPIVKMCVRGVAFGIAAAVNVAWK